MTPIEMTKWLDEFIKGGSARNVVELIANDDRWQKLSVDEKLTFILLVLGRIRAQ